jgi:hypothetical protein
MPASRSIASVLLRSWETFLYILVRHEAPFDRVGWKAHLWAVAAAR